MFCYKPDYFSHVNDHNVKVVSIRTTRFTCKSRKACIKTNSPLASLPLKGQIAKHTTVKWAISSFLIGSPYTAYQRMTPFFVLYKNWMSCQSVAAYKSFRRDARVLSINLPKNSGKITDRSSALTAYNCSTCAFSIDAMIKN